MRLLILACLTAIVATNAMAAVVDACPEIANNTCYRIEKDSYNNAPASVTDCCKACKADRELCQGFTVTASGTCNLLDQFNNSRLYSGSGCTSGRVHHGGQLPVPPADIRPSPSGAKNVLFLVADDMRPSIGPYATQAQREAGAWYLCEN